MTLMQPKEFFVCFRAPQQLKGSSRLAGGSPQSPAIATSPAAGIDVALEAPIRVNHGYGWHGYRSAVATCCAVRKKDGLQQPGDEISG